MQAIAPLLRGTIATAALALIFATFASAAQPDSANMCDSVDEVIAIAAGLGADPDEITNDFRRIADRYQQVADELEDLAAAQLRRLAQVTAQAADDLDAIDLRDEINHLTDVSDAVAEMSDTINANPPIGLGADAMDQIERQCDPDFSDLTQSD